MKESPKRSVKIGTSGYSYDDWRGIFYPRDLPKGDMLPFYAQHFDAVEINSTYYRIPHRAVFYHLGQKTPDQFEFIVKMNQATTHVRDDDYSAVSQIIESIRPLDEMGKFCGFLAQFPYSFKNTPTNRDYLRRVKEHVKEYPLFVEFRNWSWNRPEIFEFLLENDIGYVNVDQPRLRGLLPPQDVVTTKLGYVRFHGRNQKNWWDGTNETRYNYLYRQEELEEWLIRLSRIMGKTYKTYIFFNNHPQGKAIKNARMLKKLLEEHPGLFDRETL